jgi:hypothetical protein
MCQHLHCQTLPGMGTGGYLCEARLCACTSGLQRNSWYCVNQLRSADFDGLGTFHG